MNEYNLPPAQLWIGSHDALIAQAMTYLQQQLCTQNACGLCVTCMQIRAQQHHAAVWICPEKQYTLEDLEIINERLSFSLANGERLFFILLKADYLSRQCANSLLKSIEEPPEGYRFIFCCERAENILPTIQSRCIIQSFTKEKSTGPHADIYGYFVPQALNTPQTKQSLAFLNCIQKSTVTETHSIELIDRLLAYWMQKYTDSLTHNQPDATALKYVNFLKRALLHPPMPGSSKLFWKNLFVQFYAQ